jgi:hypothetical protein
MSLTATEGIYVGVNEAGFNDLISAVTFPRYLNHRTPGYPPGNVPLSDWTTDLPLFLGTTEFAVQFVGPPRLDIDPIVNTLPAVPVNAIPVPPNDLLWRATCNITLVNAPSFPLDTFARLTMNVANPGPGTGTLTFQLVNISVALQPQVQLPPLLLPFLPFILQAISGFLGTLLTPFVNGINLPLNALRVGAFTLAPTLGPFAQTNTLELLGAVY